MYADAPSTAPTALSTKMRPTLRTPRSGPMCARPNSTACSATAVTAEYRESSPRNTRPRNTISSTMGAAMTASTSIAIT
jgi:hypothetical protein